MKAALLMMMTMYTLTKKEEEEEPKPQFAKHYGNRIPSHPKDGLKDLEDKKNDGLKTELHEAAFKIAHYYVRVFDFMDKNIDDYIDHAEISEIYE